MDLKFECILVSAISTSPMNEPLTTNKHGKVVVDGKTLHSARKLFNVVLSMLLKL